MFGLGSQEVLVILVIALVLYGGSTLPQLARSLGRSVNEFKKGMNEDRNAKDEPVANEQAAKDQAGKDKDGAARG